MSKRRWMPWVIVLVVLAVAVAAAVVGWIWANPLAYHAWSGRRTLFADGFVEKAVAGYQGTLVYLQKEPKEGAPTLVFLHGAGDQAGAWSQVAPAFADRYRVLVPDLAGHGDSAPFTGPLPFDAVVEGFDALMRQALPDYQGKAVLVGNSMGAWVASVYAQRHPDRVARLVLVDGGPIRGDSGLSLIPKDRAEARKLMAALRDPASPPVPDFVLDDIVQHAATGPIGRMAQVPESMEKYLLDDQLNEITVPTDLIWGRSDHLLPMAYAERLAAGLPRARLIWLDRCGHVPENECPQELTEALEKVLAAQEPPQAARSGQSPPPAARSGQSPPPAARSGQSPPPAARSGQSPPAAARSDESPPPAARPSQSPPPADSPKPTADGAAPGSA